MRPWQKLKLSTDVELLVSTYALKRCCHALKWQQQAKAGRRLAQMSQQVLTHAKVLETETATLGHQRSKKEKEKAKNA